MSNADDVLDSDTIIEYARLLDEGDELDFAHTRYEFSNPMRVVDVEVVEWDAFTTATIELDQGINSFGDPNHIVRAVSDDPPRWQHPTNDDAFVVTFSPHDYDEADLATADFADRIESGTRVQTAPVAPAENSAEVSDASEVEAPPEVNTMAARVPCHGCGASVTKDYARVFAPSENPQHVEACPNCPNMTRGSDGRARENKHLAAGGD